MDRVYVNKKLLILAIVLIIVFITFFLVTEDAHVDVFGFTKEEKAYIENNQTIKVTLSPYYDYKNHSEALSEKIFEDTGLRLSISLGDLDTSAFYQFDKGLYFDGKKYIELNYQGDYIEPNLRFSHLIDETHDVYTDADVRLTSIIGKIFSIYDQQGLFQTWRDENNFNSLKTYDLPSPEYQHMRVGITNNPPIAYVNNQNIYGSSILFINGFVEFHGLTIDYILGEQNKLEELLNDNELDIMLTKDAELSLFFDKLLVVSPKDHRLMSQDASAIPLNEFSYHNLFDHDTVHFKVPAKLYEFNQALTNHQLYLNAITDETITFGFSGNELMIKDLQAYANYVSLDRLESLSYLNFPDERDSANRLRLMIIVASLLGFLGLVVIIVRFIMSMDERKRLNYLFKHDQLTYLLNHNGLKQVFKKVAYESGYLMLVDLRHFKLLNDTYGSDIGDQILISLSQVFSKLDDSLHVARTSGDQYMFLSENERNLQGILEAFLAFKSDHPHASNLDISASYVSFPEHGQTFDVLNQYLESAMYHAKSINKINAWVAFNEAIYKNFLEEQELSLEIQKALDHNNFSLFYQPQTDLKTDKTIGAEVLIRWHHHERGTIYPDQFLGVAERNGLMRQIDMYMIRHACQQIKVWQENNYKKMKISVNMSTYTFEGVGMSEELLSIVSSSSIDTSWLALEITEESGLTNIDKAKLVMNNIKAQGIRFALDDFGKGYSSINYLEKLPFDFLKIDKAFVDYIHTSEKSKRLYYLITDLAKLYDMHIIAEGVEYKEQIDIIKKDMDTIIQGYYYSKPLTLEDFEHRINNQ